MFENTPRTTPFVSADANAYFEDKIYGDMWCHDVVFMSTLRALMSRKMSENPTVRVSFPGRYTPRNSGDVAVYSAVTSQLNLSARNVLYIVSLNESQEEANRTLTVVSDRIGDDDSGFIEVRKFRDFFDRTKKITGRYFANVENRTGLLFLDRLSKQRLQVIAQQIPALLPWFFPDASSVTAKELELLKALSEQTPDHWLRVLDEISSSCIDYRKERIRSMLSDFEVSGDREDIGRKEQTIQTLLDYIKNAKNQIDGWYAQIRETSDMIAGIKLRMEESVTGDTPLMQLFMNAANLDVDQINGRVLSYRVRDVVQIFDEFQAESYINNFRSPVYSGAGQKREDLKKILKAVFIDKTLFLRVCGMLDLTIGGTIRARQGARYGREYNTYLPNPHLDHYGCTGGYDDLFSKLMRKGSFAAAINQSILAVQTINWSDQTVMRSFGPDILEKWESQTFQKPDGTLISAAQFVKESENEKEA